MNSSAYNSIVLNRTELGYRVRVLKNLRLYFFYATS